MGIYVLDLCLFLDIYFLNPLLMNFLIVSSGVNCQMYIHTLIQSVQFQRYKHLRAIFIDDGSDDRTKMFLSKKVADPRFTLELHSDNQGAAKRRWDAIKKYSQDPEDVILLLGMDDYLDINALCEIKKEYDAGKWMTYGNWKDNAGIMLPKGFLDFTDEEHETRAYRSVRYRSTAPNTFKRFLFDQLTEDDFKVDGEWVRATTESNLMFSCLEMCGKDRIGVIKQPIYIYNKRGRYSTKNFRGITYQRSIYNNFVNRPKKPLYESIAKLVA